MEVEEILAVVTALTTIIATILSYKAIKQADKSIKQTEKNSVIGSNQFLFDRRLELINYFRAVISEANGLGLHVTEITEDTRKDAEDVFEVDEKIKQLKGILDMQFSAFTNNLCFYELGSMIIQVSEGSAENYEIERKKCVIFIDEMRNKIESVDYLFSDNSLKLELKNILEGYVDVLKLYNTLFYELHTVKGAYDFPVFFLTYDNMKKNAAKLKKAVENINIEETNATIKEELSVF